MSEVNFLFTHLSAEEVIVLIIVMILAVKAVWSAAEWIWKKIRSQLDISNDKDKWEKNITDSLNSLDKKIDNLELQNQKTHEEQEKINDTLKLVQERLQENTRSFLIDAHHKFCYQIKSIDDMNLQSIERRYLFYKTAGGNSFIDGLMEEIRALPRMNIYTIDKENEEKDGRD